MLSENILRMKKGINEVVNMSLFEVTLVKIGKLATPAVLVIAGVVLVICNQVSLGICTGIAGLLVYLLVWRWTTESALRMAKMGLNKEKIKLKKEQIHKERIIAGTQARTEAERLKNERIFARTQERTEKERLAKDKIKNRWRDRLEKQLWDSL